MTSITSKGDLSSDKTHLNLLALLQSKSISGTYTMNYEKKMKGRGLIDDITFVMPSWASCLSSR